MTTQAELFSRGDGTLPLIKISTFGTLQVVRLDHAVTESDWHTRQARQLLKILITERPRPVSSDRLIEILWPNSSPSAAATTLRSAINALRNVLEPDRPNRAPSLYIITQAPGYSFHLHPDIWLDVEVFERELNTLNPMPNSGIKRQRLEALLALYKDDYLISDPYADWVHNERERLQERYFTALLQLAELQAQSGDHTAAITSCRRILAKDEVRENAYQALMRYQAESGDSASALLSYERCRTILAEELGADPSPLTQMLHRRILNGEIEPYDVETLTFHSAQPRDAGQGVGATASRSVDLGTPASLPQHVLMPVFDAQFTEFFVGREAELGELEKKLTRALQGSGELVVLEGEAGVGKSRLAHHLLRKAAELEATVITASCQALEQQLPFAPLADALGRYLHSLSDDSLQSLPTASLAQLAQIIPSLQDRLPDLPPPTQDSAIGADENRQRLTDGIVGLLATLSRLRPLVFFLDDLHWADHDTLAVLGRLANRAGTLSLFVLLAYRSDDLAENEALMTLLHAMKRTHHDHLTTVQRLRQQHVQRLIHLITGQPDEQSAQLASMLYDATLGNALFVTEAMRALRERQATSDEIEPQTLTMLASAWSRNSQNELRLGRSQRVQEVILERIERLPATARNVLHLAAVIGRDFSLELLESAATEDPVDCLQILLDRQFLVERADERLDFSHQVVRQVAYDSLNMLQRRRLHLAVADSLVALGRARQNPAEVAFHFSCSGTKAREPFAHYSVLAGERLLRAFGFRQALVHFDTRSRCWRRQRRATRR
ncbi:MAG: AAA family ATPase [Caldilineaceae bacterium]|nr:AAA family ATPase [Caldilineaceae bacterium]